MIIGRQRFATLLIGGLALLTLAACGSNPSAAGGNPSAPSGGSSSRFGGQGGGAPGVSGLIVALSGKTMQVRTSSGQSAVTYTSKTAVTEEKSAKISDVKAGLCATIRSTADASAATPSSTVTARTVNLSDPVDGSCRGGFGGGRPSGQPSGGAQQGQPPSLPPGAGAPSGRPSGAAGGFAPGGFGASGLITSVSGSTMVVEETRRSSSTGASSTGASSTKTSVTVTLAADTTYTKQQKVGTSTIATGKCVFAAGKTDSTGAMTASGLRLSAPVEGQCTFGAGRRQGAPSGGRTGG